MHDASTTTTTTTSPAATHPARDGRGTTARDDDEGAQRGAAGASGGAGASDGAPDVRPTFREIYTEHFEFVWRSLRRLGVPPAAQDDAVQEVFIAVHQGLAGFELRSSIRTWIYGIAMRVALNHHRAVRRKGGGAHDPLAVADEVPDERAPDPHDAAARGEALRTLERLMANMDEDKREVLLLTELEQLTAPEIAQILGLSVNTVYSRLRAARAEFDAAVARLQRRNG